MPAAGGFPQHSSGTFWDLPFGFHFPVVSSWVFGLFFFFFLFLFSHWVQCQDVPCGWSGLIRNRTSMVHIGASFRSLLRAQAISIM